MARLEARLEPGRPGQVRGGRPGAARARAFAHARAAGAGGARTRALLELLLGRPPRPGQGPGSGLKSSNSVESLETHPGILRPTQCAAPCCP